MASHFQQATIQRFEQLMRDVVETIPDQVGDDHSNRLATIEMLTEQARQEIEARGFTHPPKVLSDLREAFHTFREAPRQLAARSYPRGYLLLWYLLWCYRDDWTASEGAD